MSANLRSGLPRRRRARALMGGFARLPAPERAWAHLAVLPWSPVSIARIWARALALTGSEAEALVRCWPPKPERGPRKARIGLTSTRRCA